MQAIEVPKNGSEEEIITFLESKKWVKSYNDLYYIVGKFWEPSRDEINTHHNYTSLTEYLNVRINVLYFILSRNWQTSSHNYAHLTQ